MILLICCLLTVAIELPFMMACGYRSRYEVTVIVCVNVVSNLLLNLLLAYVFKSYAWPVILIMELCVVALEYAVMAYAFGRSRRLLLLTFAANVLSYTLGALILRALGY